MKLIKNLDFDSIKANSIYAEVLNYWDNLCARFFCPNFKMSSDLTVMFNDDRAKRLNWKKCFTVSFPRLVGISDNGVMVFSATIDLDKLALLTFHAYEVASYLFDKQVIGENPKVLFIVDLLNGSSIVIADDGRFDPDPK